jgi:hypothetical protein
MIKTIMLEESLDWVLLLLDILNEKLCICFNVYLLHIVILKVNVECWRSVREVDESPSLDYKHLRLIACHGIHGGNNTFSVHHACKS